MLSSNDASKTITFKRIKLPEKERLRGFSNKTFTMKESDLLKKIRVPSQNLSAVFEGLALVKMFDYSLKFGEIKIDVSARDQFLKKLPVVRRVKAGKYHILITYDPDVIYGGSPRSILLENFDGHTGLSLTLPADDQTRIYVVQED